MGCGTVYIQGRCKDSEKEMPDFFPMQMHWVIIIMHELIN